MLNILAAFANFRSNSYFLFMVMISTYLIQNDGCNVKAIMVVEQIVLGMQTYAILRGMMELSDEVKE